ncbi:MAG TPA: carotenoid biosynthesis protein [Candidatus Acidoferrales bacterium]|nr:carotenoid biosynthesis protein [Candidatus Acidoferrales bacterium]
MNNPSQLQRYVNIILWALVAVYAYSRVLQVFPARASMLTVVALHVLPPALFALIHGALLYRTRGILVFIAICLVVGNVFENLGVRTGFPYGHYYFTSLMGPKILVVPVFLGLAYVGMAYLSWCLASILLTSFRSSLEGARVVTVPLLAALIMVAWDLAMDPIWSTVMHAWIWKRGGPYFGVPISNFFGWYLVVYIIYQSFALYLRNRPIASQPLPPNDWHLPILFYAAFAAGNLVLAIPHHGISGVTDASGAQWKVSSIVAACVVVSICLMGSFALIAWLRLAQSNAKTPRPTVPLSRTESESLSN